jgi:hypothetical protein
MAAHSQFGIRGDLFHSVIERRTVGHQCRAGENPFAMSANDSLVHTARHSKIIGVKNQIFHLGSGHFAAAHVRIASALSHMQAASLSAARKNFSLGRGMIAISKKEWGKRSGALLKPFHRSTARKI